MKKNLFILSLLTAFFLTGPVFSISAPLLKARSKVPCNLRRSNLCKNPNVFQRDEKDGCAAPLTQCRSKFCTHNCLGQIGPEKESVLYKLCQASCDPDEVTTFNRQERKVFEERFEGKSVQRKRALRQRISNMNSNLPRCEELCDYEEPSNCIPKTRTKVKEEDRRNFWEKCAETCGFIEDIKNHALFCSTQKPTPQPRPRAKRPPKPRPRPLSSRRQG